MVDTLDASRARARAGWLSLFAGSGILLGKLATWGLTGSSAVLSDAMESIVNVVAAALLVFSLRVAARPADRDHPYGHGKVEFFSAGIEGALIATAALLIVVQAVRELWTGVELRRLDLGLVMLVALSGVNALLGWNLVRVGRRTGSMALVADGRHVLTDVWTSAGVVVALGAVWMTGWVQLDPIVALLVAGNILLSGWKLLRESIQGLMDAADEDTLGIILLALERARENSWIDVHGLRAWRAGAALHADLHMTVPRYYDVEAIHAIHERVLGALYGEEAGEGDAVVHFDPCRPRHCPSCCVSDCPVRSSPFRSREPLALEASTGPADTGVPDPASEGPAVRAREAGGANSGRVG